MKRFLAMVLTAVMAFSLAACGGGGSEETVPTEKVDTAVAPLTLYKGGNYLQDWELYQAEWQKLYLSEEDEAAYPALAEVLDEMNMEQEVYNADWAHKAEEDARMAMNEMGEYFYGFTNDSDYFVQRADNRILSIREDFSEYYGGAHGMYGTVGHVIDTVTGERLGLGDVITDTDAVPGILSEKLQEKYPDDITYDITENLEGYALEDFVWTVDYQGVTFYFNPYELASYAAGRLTVTIWFEEYPALFDETLAETPEGGYIKEIPLHDDIEVDLVSADGKRDTVCVIGDSFDEYDGQQIRIYRNEEAYSDTESYGYRFTPHLVCQDDRFYLLVEGSAENEYRTIYVYDLNEAELKACDINPGVGFHTPEWEPDDECYGMMEVLNDPAELCLDTLVQLLSTMSGKNTYEFVNGILLMDQPYYTLPEDFPPLVSKMPLEVYFYEEDVTEEMPAGTEFYFLYTDNDSYVDMKVDGDRVCRLEVRFDGWGRTVNGIPEYDAFDGILYAG